jgi:YVTN family beta-propeller protein
MRFWVRSGLALSILASVLAGCGGGGKHAATPAASIAPSTSSTTPPGQNGGAIPGTSTITSASVPAVQVPVGHNAYVASFLLNQLQVIEDSSLTVQTTVQVGNGPTAVAVNGNYAYVTNSLDQNVAIVDRLTNTVTSTIDVGAISMTGISMIDSLVQPLRRPTGIAVLPNGTKAFTANLIDVTSVDLIGRKPLKSIFAWNLNLSGGLSGLGTTLTNFLSQPLAAAGPTRVAATNTHAWVTNVMTNNVTMISATDDKVMLNTTVGKLPFGVTCANGKVYVACAMTNEIWVLDEATGAVKTSFQAGLMPMDVAASPAGDRIYVSNFMSGDITIIDTSIDIPVGTLPAGMSFASMLQSMGMMAPGTGSTGLSGVLGALLGGGSATGSASASASASGSLSGILAALLGGGTTGATTSGTGSGTSAIGSLLASILGGGSLTGGAGSGTSTFGSLLAALLGGGSSTGAPGGLLNPQTLMSTIMSAMLSAMGMNSSSLSSLSLPGIGVASISVNATGTRVICGNWFMGQVTVTDTTTLQVTGTMPASAGIGPVEVAAAR